jgi:ABC-type antimicrobial peptide transport system permease subunit
MEKKKKSKKKFKETKVGIFLKEKGPKILDTIGDVLPNNGVYGVVKNLISQDEEMDSADKDLALKMIDQDIAEMQGVSERWEYDMKSDSWLSKNTRPLTLIYLTVCMTLFIVFDSIHMLFDMKDVWIELLKTLLVTVYVAYFGSRGAEKVFINKNKD